MFFTLHLALVSMLMIAPSNAKVNNSPPQISIYGLGNKALEIRENLSPGVTVGLISVNDPDGSALGIECRINEKKHFKLVQTITMNKKKMYKLVTAQYVDRELQATLKLSVTCKDGGSPSFSSVLTRKIKVLDVNDNAPVFLVDHYYVSVLENVPTGAMVGRVMAVDADTGKNAQLYYSLSGAAAQLFSIDSKTGVFSTRVKLDRESIGDKISFRVIARDNKNYRSALVTVTIVDENDNRPRCLFPRNNARIDISKKTPVGYIIFRALAADEDSGQNGRIEFRMVTKTKKFRIDDRGNVYLNRKLSATTSGKHNLVIQVSDFGEPPKSTLCTVSITVLP